MCLYQFLLLDFGFPCWFWSVRAQVLEEIAAWPHAHGTSPAQPRAAPARAALRPGTAPAASRGTCIPGEALQARPGAARHVRARPCRSDARRPLPSRPQLLAAASCRHAQACARGAGGLRPASPAARGARPSAAERQEQGPGCSREACPGMSTSRSNKQRSQGIRYNFQEAFVLHLCGFDLFCRPIRDGGQASSRPSSAASHPLHAQHAAAQHDVNEREHSEPLSSLPLI